MMRKVSFKTFDSSDISLGKEESTKTIGIGLSTADALASHLGGRFYLKDIKDSKNVSVATEAVFTVPTCSNDNCHHYSLTLKQARFEERQCLPFAFQSYEISSYFMSNSREHMSSNNFLTSS